MNKAERVFKKLAEEDDNFIEESMKHIGKTTAEADNGMGWPHIVGGSALALGGYKGWKYLKRKRFKKDMDAVADEIIRQVEKNK